MSSVFSCIVCHMLLKHQTLNQFIPLPSQTLTDDFRLTYGKLWMGLIRGNVKKIKKYGERLGAGELFPLFACMVTARSWDSVAKGIDKKHVTQEEVRIRLSLFVLSRGSGDQGMERDVLQCGYFLFQE